MRALVTGAQGFVGRHLVAHLTETGDEVSGIDLPDGPDLLDLDGLRWLLSDRKPEVVYHLGGWSDVGASWDHPIDCFRVNAEGTFNLLEACRTTSGPRVLVVSSADVYGKVRPEELPLTETSPYRPVTPYSASKIAADELAHQAWLGHGLETVRVRAFNHLGPGQTTRFVAPAIAERIAINERDGGRDIAVGNLTPRRDITDVRDVVRAYRMLMVDGRPGEAYNVCTGVDLSMEQLAERLIELATVPMVLRPDPELQRPVETPVLRGDNSKLRTDTGWEPTIPIDRTLVDVLTEQRLRIGVSPN